MLKIRPCEPRQTPVRVRKHLSMLIRSGTLPCVRSLRSQPQGGRRQFTFDVLHFLTPVGDTQSAAMSELG